MKYSVQYPLEAGLPLIQVGTDNHFFRVERSAEAAAHLCGELNRLDRDLNVQIEAKCKFIKKSEDLERQVQTLVTVIRESQKILARHVEPNGKKLNRDQLLTEFRQTVTDLLEILDHRDLVTLVNGFPCGSNSEEATPGDGYPIKPVGRWPTWATHLFNTNDGWHFGRLIEEKSARHWVDADKDYAVTQLWTEANIIAGSLEERLQPLAVEGEQVFINGALIREGTITDEQATLSPVVNNTTNHFAPRKIGKKQLEALDEAIEIVRLHGRGPDGSNVVERRLRKLLRKLR